VSLASKSGARLPTNGNRKTVVLQPKMTIAGFVDATIKCDCPHIRGILINTLERWKR